jgi:uncharacterized protein
MKIEKISWISEELKIIGEIFSPSDRSGPFPVLILCHGIPAKSKTPDDRGYALLAERFCREGFLVLTFNFRGAGLSEGNFDILGWTKDLEGGLDFLALRPDADSKRILLMGFSAGAAVSIYVAAHRKEIAALVSCASPANFDDLLTKKGGEEFLLQARDTGIIRDPKFPPSLESWQNNFKIVKPIDWVHGIPPRPFLIIHGTGDEVVDVNHAQRLHNQVKGKPELFLIDGGGHRLRLEETAMKKACTWLKQVNGMLEGRKNPY